MAKYESKSLKSLAIIGQGGTGKTSLCESLIYVAGKSERLGRVDDGTSSLDYEPEEQKRRISISAAVSFLECEKQKITIIDTPGDSNFAYDTKNCLQNVDNALVVIDAVGGVEFQTEMVWEYAKEFKMPKAVFINRMDRERADFFKVLESIKGRLGDKVTPIFLPIGVAETFQGIVDLLENKAIYFDDPKGAGKSGDIPEEMKDIVEEYRNNLTEDIAECDEQLMDKYLSDGELSLDDLKSGLKVGISSGSLIPLMCGSAVKHIGVSALIGLILNYLPSPVERGLLSGKLPGTDTAVERPPDVTAPFAARVFKTIADPYAGRLTLFRVYSGSLTSDTSVLNTSRKVNERIGNIFYLDGKVQKPADGLVAGDIAAVAKLKETVTGDTLCSEKFPIIFDKVTPIPSIMSFAIEPKSRGDEEKIVSSIHRLIEEDPTLTFTVDRQTKEMILSGMGQVHIEVTVEKMKRKFGVDVVLNTPKVPYKETIKGKTTIQGKYKKQSGGRGQFGDAWLEIEPLPRGTGFEFADKIVGGVIPHQYRPAVEKGIIEAMLEGVLAGYPMVDLKVSLIDGSYHTVDSSEMAFKIAGSMGYKKGVLSCQPVLLEPIVNINIEIPEEYMGDVMGDLNGRRGRVLGMDSKGSHQIVKGQVPLAEILKYAPDLRSMTSGRGTFTYEHAHYDEVPPYIAEKIIAAAKKSEE